MKEKPAKGIRLKHIASGPRLILDILTVLFFVFGFALILWMVGERRRDVLHGPYMTKSGMAPGDVSDDRLDGVERCPSGEDNWDINLRLRSHVFRFT